MLSYWEQNNLTTYDTIILGAGLAGLFTALNLKRKFPKEHIIILDKEIFPAASTKNAGFACMGSVSELEDDIQSQKMDAVVSLFRKRYEGLRILRAELGDQAIGYQENGSYELIDEQPVDIDDKIHQWNQLLRPIVGRNAFSLADIGQTQFRGFAAMIKNELEGEIHTGQMWNALRNKVLSSGVQLLTNMPVGNFQYTHGQYELTLDTDVRLKCGRLILCTNAFTNQLLPNMAIRPARGQVLITKPIKDLAVKGIYHFDRGYYYFRAVDDRILFGGGRQLDVASETTMSFGSNNHILEDLQTKLREQILPDKDVEIDYSWSGIMGFGESKEPICQALGNNLYALAGFGGMGVALAPFMAKELIRLVD